MRAARAACLFFLARPIKSVICGFVVAVPVVDAAWFPYDRNDRSTMIATIAAHRSLRSSRAYGNIHSEIFAIVATVIAEFEKFLSLRSLRSTVATIAKIAEYMFPHARKDCSDRCAAIVAIIWKPGLKLPIRDFCNGNDIATNQ